MLTIQAPPSLSPKYQYMLVAFYIAYDKLVNNIFSLQLWDKQVPMLSPILVMSQDAQDLTHLCSQFFVLKRPAIQSLHSFLDNRK